MTETQPGAAPQASGPAPAGTPSAVEPQVALAAGPPRDGPFLNSIGVPPFTKLQGWRWVFYAVVGFLVGQVAATIFGVAAGAIDGKTSRQLSALATSAQPPEWYVVSTLVGIWLGYVGAPWLASRTAGTGRFFRDLGLRFRPIDALGIVIGVVSQLAVDLLYKPFQHDIANYNAPTQKLIGASHGSGGVLIIVLASVIFAPFAEELCFRGLLFKGLVRLCAPVGGGPGTARTVGVVGAVILDGLLFGLAHGEWVQLAGLALFGMVLASVSYRTGRLGMNMVAHASFNLVAVISYFNWIH
jgi:membrane protease YdiL (CAAX protease family)